MGSTSSSPLLHVASLFFPFRVLNLTFNSGRAWDLQTPQKEIFCSRSSSITRPHRNLVPGVLTHIESPRSSSVLGWLTARERHCQGPTQHVRAEEVPVPRSADEKAEVQRGEGILSGLHSVWKSRTGSYLQILAQKKNSFSLADSWVMVTLRIIISPETHSSR